MAMTLTLNFQGQTWNLLYLSPKWSDCHETKSKHIDSTQGLKYGHQVWPWPWPWPRFFKVKYVICYNSAQNGPIVMKRKANISIELKTSNVTLRFDLGNDLDLWIFKVKCDLDLWPYVWCWPRIFLLKFWNRILIVIRALWYIFWLLSIKQLFLLLQKFKWNSLPLVRKKVQKFHHLFRWTNNLKSMMVW